MKTIGLTTDPDIQKYLSEAHGLDFVSTESGVPLFSLKHGETSEYFLGGFKSFYTLAPDATREDVNRVIEGVSHKGSGFQCLISVPFSDSRATLTNYVLDCSRIADSESRLDSYEKKTRNLVRKSYKNAFTVRQENSTKGFYELYSASLARLGGIAKSREWFSTLEKSISGHILVFSLFDGDKLIASNYCLRTEGYIFLMFNVSDPAYWEYAVNDRLYDELVHWSLLNSIRYIDFGPSVMKDATHAHFKAGFGASQWFIITSSRGSILYRLKRFVGQKRHNLRLRFMRGTK